MGKDARIIDTNLKKLDIGCGYKKHKNCFGIDISEDSDADLIFNVEKGLPFKDNSFKTIYCENIVEHIRNFDLLMDELKRVGKNNCKIVIKTPHYSSRYAWMDLTHVRPFAYNSFETLKGLRVIKKKLIYIDAFNTYFRIFLKTVFFIPTILALLFPNVFERFLCYLFGGIDYIDLELKVEK